MINTRTEERDVFYFSEHDEVSFSGLFDQITKAVEAMDSPKGVPLKFYIKSTMEPYEDSLGPAVLVATWQRSLSKKEIAEEKWREETQAYATKLGITFYEATVALVLIKKGVLKDGH